MSDVTISVGANGPYGVSGGIELVDANGNVIPTDPAKTVWLCRCGHSQDKPFCDGSHKRQNFVDPGVRPAE